MAAEARPILCVGTTPALQRTMRFGAVTAGDVNRATAVHEYASGKPVNVARCLKALKRPHRLLIPLGGARGAAAGGDLAGAGIEAEVVEVAAQTRLCITVISDATASATELVEEQAPLEPEVGDQILEMVEESLPQAGVLVLSGSVARGIGDGFYARALRLARRAGTLGIIDASGPPLMAALEERPAVVKLNRAELATTLPAQLEDTRSLGKALAGLARTTGGWVVVTDGVAGSYAGDGSRLWHITSPRVQAISAIGSGDAFAAGLAAGLMDGREMPESCRLGAACGAANALTPYAGHIAPERALALLAQVRLEELAQP